MSLGTNNRIKILRKSKRLSQTDFAALFSVDQTAVSNWENGKNSIDMSICDKIADYFMVPIEFVYGKKYTLTRPISEWSDDELSKYKCTRSSEEREFCEFIFGRGVFEGSNTTIGASKSYEKPSEDDIKAALFGGDNEVTDEMWDEVKKFVEFIKSKKDR